MKYSQIYNPVQCSWVIFYIERWLGRSRIGHNWILAISSWPSSSWSSHVVLLLFYLRRCHSHFNWIVFTRKSDYSQVISYFGTIFKRIYLFISQLTVNSMLRRRSTICKKLEEVALPMTGSFWDAKTIERRA